MTPREGCESPARSPRPLSLSSLCGQVARARGTLFLVFATSTGFSLLLSFATAPFWSQFELSDLLLVLESLSDRPDSLTSAVRVTVCLCLLYALLAPLLSLYWLARLSGLAAGPALASAQRHYVKSLVLTGALLFFVSCTVGLAAVCGVGVYALLESTSPALRDLSSLGVFAAMLGLGAPCLMLIDLGRGALLAEGTLRRALRRATASMSVRLLASYLGFCALGFAFHTLSQVAAFWLTDSISASTLALVVSHLFVFLALSCRGTWLALVANLHPASAHVEASRGLP